jgi:RHS repeat-associated protein
MVNHVYLNGVRVAAVAPSGSASYYLTDQVDSVTVVLDDGGKIVTQHEYLPFGETWITEGDKKNAPKYNSQELDKETNFYFYNARHYDPEIGRFVTADTVIDGEEKDENGKIIRSDPLGWNRYLYCKGNPIIYKDPTGHKTVWLAGAGNEKNSADYSVPIVQKMSEQGIKRPMYLDLKNEEGLYNQGVRAVKSALGITDKSVIDKISKTYDRSDGQYNLVGYSKGAVEAGKAALDMANKGKVIDNLVLIGSPIKTNSDLYKSLTSNKNIKKITKIDISGDFLTNKEGRFDMGSLMEWSKKAIKEKEAEISHFYYTTNKDGRQDKLVTTLKKSGLK